MNINRHNYEEFFLMYVDKELSAADRKAVDMFVQENPDLKIELDLLQDTVIPADDIVLDKKDWLYKEEGVTALQENLLLYADEELNPTDKRSVEAMLATNKAARAEWTLLKQTKLQPDLDIVFEDKQSLYRKEAGRVVGFSWGRVAAAAVLLGFGLWTGVAVYKNSSTATATENLVKSGKDQQKNVTPLLADTAAQNNTTGNNTVASTTAQENEQSTAPVPVQAADHNAAQQQAVTAKENIAVQNNNSKKPGNDLPAPLQNINNNNSNENVVAGVQPLNNNSSRVSGSNDAVVKITPRENTNNALTASAVNNPEQRTVAVQAVNTNADGDTNGRYLNVDDDKEKRTALGGFLRKAKRVIERTTNVKTGEGIKVAGFEIALK